jgi:hypothetical protein
MDEEWAKELPGAIIAAVDFIQRAALEADPTKAANVKAMAVAMKVLHDMQVTQGVLDVRFARALGQATGQPRQMGTRAN